MATLAAIEKQIAELKKKADSLRQAEAKSAIAQVRELIQRFGLTAEDLGLTGKAGKRMSKLGAKTKTKAPGLPKYRDPATGKTWTGHGKPPTWIAGVADRTPFLIEGAAAVVAAQPAKAAKATKAPKAPAAPKSKPAAKSSKAAAAKKSPARKARSEAAAETPPPAQA